MSLFKSEKKKPVAAPSQTAAPAVEPKTAAEPKTVAPTAGYRPHYAVLERPWISEKALIGTSRGQYVFRVAPKATKPSVKDEVERRYGVHVRAVNIVRLTAKQKHFRGVTSHKMVQKKAVITLKAGEKIDVQ